MMCSLIPHVSLVANFTRRSFGIQRVKYLHLGRNHYQSVCGIAKYHCTTNRNQYNINKRLLDPKPAVQYQPFSVEYHILQKYIFYLSPEEGSRYFNSSSPCNCTLRSAAISSKYFYSTSNEKEVKKSTEGSSPEEDFKKLPVVQRFKAMLKDYWHVLLPVHVITSIGWFGGFYFLATSGIDIPALMEILNFSEDFVKPFRDSSMGYIAVAYGLYKVATPARYTITVGGTSIAIRILKKRGLVKPWPINFKWLKREKKS